MRLLVTVLWTLRLTGGGEMEGSLSSSGAGRCRLEEDIVQACRDRSRDWSWVMLLRWFQPERLTRWKHFGRTRRCINGQRAGNVER